MLLLAVATVVTKLHENDTEPQTLHVKLNLFC